MQIFKVGLVMAAGLGSTWAAREATDAWLGPPPGATLVQAQPAEPGQPQPAAGGTAAPAAVPRISRQEMEDELKRAQAELAGKSAAGDVEEFRPSRPLAADIAIALPSDM